MNLGTRKKWQLFLNVVADLSDKRLPDLVRARVAALSAQRRTLKAQVRQFGRMIMAWNRSNETIVQAVEELPVGLFVAELNYFTFMVSFGNRPTPCGQKTSTWRNFATISSACGLFLGILQSAYVL